MARDQQVFTLIETIITIVLLAIMTSGLMAMFSAYSTSNGNSPVIIQEAELAQEKIEMIIADKENSARGFNYVTAANYPAENPVGGFANFTRSVTIIYVDPASSLNTPAAGTTNYKNVTVTVSGVVGSVTTSTLMGSF